MVNKLFARRDFLQLAGITTINWLILGLIQGCQGNSANRPNIICILADDLGYGDLGCYGQTVIKTPNLDIMAAEGIKFTHCYSPSPVCAPTRWGLMTGKHTGHAHTTYNAGPLYPEDITVAEYLHSAGYYTIGLGKWANGDPNTTGTPSRQGFDYWFGYLNQVHAHNYYTDYLYENETFYPILANTNGQKNVYTPDLFTQKSLDFINNATSLPFFMYLAYILPHANNELYNETGDGMEIPTDVPYSGQLWPPPEKNFAAMVTRLDSYIGRIIQALKNQGLDQNTIIFFSSDNGPHNEGGHTYTYFNSAGPLRGYKRDLYEGGIRVPLIVRWPGKISPGVVSNHVCALYDLLPTFLELAKISLPVNIDGVSLLPALLGLSQPTHNFLYWAYTQPILKEAVRLGRWKGVRLTPDRSIELYDLDADPGETTDLSIEFPTVIAHIEQIMATYCVEPKECRYFLPVISSK